VGRAALGLAMSVGGLVGCDKEGDKPAAGGGERGVNDAGAGAVNRGGAAVAVAVAAPAVAVAGFVTGRVLGEDGRPISAAGAAVVVNVDGIGSKSAERLHYAAAMKPDGSYRQRVVDGAFRAEATLRVTFDDKAYTIRLHPVQPNTVDRESADGIVQDFVWRLTGPRPNGSGTYGPAIGLRGEAYRNDLNKPVPPAPAGSRVVFTLTPMGPLIEGREAKVITVERPAADPGADPQPEIPVARYRATGVEVLPDGTRRALQVYDWGRKGYFESADVEFPPGSTHLNGYDSIPFAFSRTVE
jgi:hypothetical protein